MIPKIIHICWFGGGEKSDTILRCEESVRRVATDYSIMYWDDSNCPKLPFVDECIRWKKWALLSDYIRLHALLQYGGIYLDTDVELVRSFDDLLSSECVIGFERPQLDAKCIGNAVLASSPGHSFIEECYRVFLCSMYTRSKPFYGVKVGNMVACRRGLRRYGTQILGDVQILARESFYPEPTSLHKDSYCIHHLEGSWHRKRGWIHDCNSIRYRTSRMLAIAHRFIQAPSHHRALRYACPKKWGHSEYVKQLIANKILDRTSGTAAQD